MAKRITVKANEVARRRATRFDVDPTVVVEAPLLPPRDLRIYAQPATGKTCLLEDYGLRGDYLTFGSINPTHTDNTPLWNAVMAKATPGDRFIIPAGSTDGKRWAAFDSQPNPLPNECQLIGHGRASTSAIVRAYNPGGGSFAPFIDVGFHTVVRDLTIMCGLNTFGGFALSRVATDPSNGAQDNVIENCFFGGIGALGSCNWTANLVLDATNGAQNFGSRSLFVRGCQFSRYTGWGLKVAAVNASLFVEMDFAANVDPPFAGLDLYVTGSPTNHNNSCKFDGASLDAIFVEHTNSTLFTCGAAGQIITAATSAGLLFMCGSVSTTPSLSSPATTVIAGGESWST